MASMLQHKGRVHGDLKAIIGFDHADLSLNETGIMSPRQAERLRRKASWRLVRMGLMLTASVVFAAAVDSSGLMGDYDSSLAKLLLLLEGLFALIGMHAGWEALMFVRDARDGRVELDDGSLQREIRDAGSSAYVVHTKRHTFRVSKAAYHAVDTTQAYRLYYAPRTKLLLAMEPR